MRRCIKCNVDEMHGWITNTGWCEKCIKMAKNRLAHCDVCGKIRHPAFMYTKTDYAICIECSWEFDKSALYSTYQESIVSHERDFARKIIEEWILNVKG
jgi:hypothetical protein